MDISITNLQKRIPIKTARIIRVVRKILKAERVPAAQLSFVFVSNPKIRALNKKFLKRNSATDVLAFDFNKSKSDELNGEIIISTDQAIHNARLYKTSSQKELMLYVIHGILHLLGFDDHTSAEIKRLRRKEEELFKIAFPKIIDIPTERME